MVLDGLGRSGSNGHSSEGTHGERAGYLSDATESNALTLFLLHLRYHKEARGFRKHPLSLTHILCQIFHFCFCPVTNKGP